MSVLKSLSTATVATVETSGKLLGSTAQNLLTVNNMATLFLERHAVAQKRNNPIKLAELLNEQDILYRASCEKALSKGLSKEHLENNLEEAKKLLEG